MALQATTHSLSSLKQYPRKDKFTDEQIQARLRLYQWSVVYRQRERIIIEAHRHGISSAEIHRITGLARSTIDNILGRGERNAV